MSIIRSLIVGIFLLFILYSCNKEPISAGGENRMLLEVVSTDGDSVFYTFFHYDVLEHLTSLKDSNNNGHSWETSIEYNLQGNPIKFMTIHQAPDGSTSGVDDSLVYSNNKVIKKLFKPSYASVYFTKDAYSYDIEGRLTCDSIYQYSTNEIYGYSNFIYDGNDDVVQVQQFNNYSGSMVNRVEIVASHDSYLNPYRKLGSILYFIRDVNLLLSKHNRTKVLYDNHSVIVTENYTYQYENGLPKKTMLTSSNGGSFHQNTIDFYYN